MLLRKHLTGGRLIELRREPGDRIVYFDFRCTNEMGDLVTNTLAVELMGRYSNLVLVQDGRIIDALKRVDFDDSEVRQLLPGLAYTLPPKPARPDFLETSAAAIVAAACEKDLPVAQALGKTVAGVGPVVVREAVCRALGETPALACDLTAEEKAGLAAAIDELKDEHAHGGTPTAVRLPQPDGAPKPVEFSFFVPQQYGSAAIFDPVSVLQRDARGLLRQRRTAPSACARKAVSCTRPSTICMTAPSASRPRGRRN